MAKKVRGNTGEGRSPPGEEVEEGQQEQEFEEIICLDGVRLRLEAPDLDGDGTIGGTENVTQRFTVGGSEQDIHIPAEMAETMKQLNEDVLDTDSRMSSIDMKSRMHPIEVNAVLAIDTLVAFKILPVSCLSLTRQRKRLNVSLLGEGRKEMVDIVKGQREHDEKKAAGMMGGGNQDKTKGFFGLGGN